MRPIHFFALLLITLCSVSRAVAQLPKEERETIARLIEEIPSTRSIQQFHAVLREPEIAGDNEVANAREQIARAKVAIPKLRSLIRVGTYIFDYPGLIARGFITFSTDHSKQGNHYEYCLWLSATYVGKEAAVLPYEFELYFDDTGIIRKIEDRRWK